MFYIRFLMRKQANLLTNIAKISIIYLVGRDINKVVRFQVETDTEMEIIKEKLYERGAFSNTYY